MTTHPVKQTKALPRIVSLRRDKKLQELEITIMDLESESAIVTKHGIEGSDNKQTDIQLFLEGKNLGKANETTHFEQACLEAQSKWNSKIREGYYEPTKTNLNTIKLPMLAHSYADRKKALEASTSCFLQLKLNGVRCTWQNGEFYSRKGQSYNHRLPFLKTFVETIAKHLKKINGFDSKKGHFLDGELICDSLSLQELAGYMNRKSDFDYGSIDDYKVFQDIRYVIYDIYMPDKSFEDRFLSIDLAFKKATEEDKFTSYSNYYTLNNTYNFSNCQIPIYLGPTSHILQGTFTHSHNKVGFLKTYKLSYSSTSDLQMQLDSAFSSCLTSLKTLQNNFNHYTSYSDLEGFIIRSNTLYELNTRTTSLLKYKQFKDAEFTIDSITSPKTGRDEGCAIYICKTDKGITFNAPPIGTQEERRAVYSDYLTNPSNYVGKPLVVQFADLTPDGVPQFPKAIRIRLED